MIQNIIRKFFSNDIRFFKSKKYFSNRIGFYAEYLVIIFMFFKCYRVLAKRYKNYAGEIDLIFIKHKSVIFVEVKARTGDIDYFGLVSNYQKNRIIKSANIFLAKYDKKNKYSRRFDICVVFSVLPWKINHIKNAWN